MPRRRTRTRSRSPFAQLAGPSGEHPIDIAVERRRPQRALKRRIKEETEALVDALGDERDRWFRVEELLGTYHLACEAAYFDLGYEHGAATGRIEALRTLGGGTPGDAFALARAVRETVLAAGLAPERTVAALLEVCWAFAVELGGDAEARDAGPRDEGQGGEAGSGDEGR